MMYKLKLLSGLSILLFSTNYAQVGIGTTSIEESAIMEVKSSTKGFLPPRLTANQKLSINTPETGLIIYCTNCCTDGALNLYNGSQWISLNACPEIDFDNDGVPNTIDLDDDNDGILDTDEGAEQFTTSNPTAFTKVSGTGTNSNVDVNDVYLYEDFLTIDGNNYDMRAEVLEISLGATTNGDSYRINLHGSLNVPALGYSGIEATENDFYRIQFSFIEANSISGPNPEGALANIPNVSATISDIESSNGDNVSEIGGIGRGKLANNTGVNPTQVFSPNANPTSQINGSFWSSTPESDNLSDMTLITMRRDLAGNVNNWTDEGTINNSSTRPNVEFQYDNVASIEMIFGVTGSVNSAPSRSMTFIIGSKFNINTDGEDNDNHLDYDTDNDGCLDALEGGGGFTSSDINGIGQLLGQVGTNGVPLVAGSGQSIGDSQVAGTCP